MSSISTTISHNIYYGTGEPYPSPLTITSTGAVITSTVAKIAVYGEGGGTLSNYGTIVSSGGDGTGVKIASPGGTVFNAGLIQGYVRGLYTGGVSYVTNSGRILSTGSGAEAATELVDGGTIVNDGTIINSARTGDGVRIDAAGATVTNSGLIEGYAESVGMQNAGILLNTATGVIEGAATSPTDFAVFEGVGGGSVTNQGTIVTNSAGGSGVLLDYAGGTLDNSGLIQAYDYGVQLRVGGAVTNSGIIRTTGANGRAAVSLGDGATLSNTGSITSDGFAQNGINGVGSGDVVFNSGFVQGYVTGLDLSGSAVVVNTGTIISLDRGFIFGQADVMLPGGGSVTNASGGFIDNGVFLNIANDGVGADSTVVNAGTIEGGVYLNSNFGPDGVAYVGTGTVFNSGTITGSPFAVYFGGADALLVLQHGYALNGLVDAAGSGPHTVELMSNPGAPVTVDFNPTEFRNFGTAGFAPGSGNAGTLALAGSVDVPGTIVGFTAVHDVVDLKFISDSSGLATAFLDPGNDQLTVTGDNGSVVLQLDPTETYSGFHAVSDGGTGTDVEVGVICFCRGTLIRTEHGDVPVERLRPGDQVRLLDGRLQPIVWIGTGQVLATRGRRGPATPVVVRRGALGANVPHEDLRVTKGHALYIDDVLIPVEYLVNHRSIFWDDRAQEVSIYHIELATHGVLLANGAPAESYRDDGNRWLFRNANTGWGQPSKEPCAPVLTGGPIVDAIWRRLLDRSGPRRGVPLTDDPDLHLVVDGRRVDASRPSRGAYVFDLPGVPESMRLVSRSAIQQELGLARDPRSLGVALRRIGVWQGSRFRIAEAGDALLRHGFHEFEADNGFRWTSGDATVPAELFAWAFGPLEVVVTVAGTTHYLDEGRRLLTA